MNSKSENKLLVPSLFVSQLSVRPMGILTGFILLDIAQTYNTTIGVSGQIITASSIAGLLVAPFLAALSIRYNPRTLLLLGISAITISSLGCSFAPNYISMLIFYSLGGLGAAIVTPMIMTIIGETIPEENRPTVIGRIVSSTPMLSTIAGLLIARILIWGWQRAYLFFAFPIILVSLILAYLAVPKTTQRITENTPSIREGFQQITGYRSAIACLLGTMLTVMAWGATMWYFASFFKEIYGVSTSIVGILWSSTTFAFVIGSWVCGKVISRYGYKRSTVYSSIVMGLSVIGFLQAYSYPFSIVCRLVFSFVAAFWMSGSNSLALGQVPEYRGAMMSLNSGFFQLGNALGSAIGGLIITYGGYSWMGVFMGLVGVLASIVVLTLAIDPVSDIG